MAAGTALPRPGRGPYRARARAPWKIRNGTLLKRCTVDCAQRCGGRFFDVLCRHSQRSRTLLLGVSTLWNFRITADIVQPQEIPKQGAGIFEDTQYSYTEGSAAPNRAGMVCKAKSHPLCIRCKIVNTHSPQRSRALGSFLRPLSRYPLRTGAGESAASWNCTGSSSADCGRSILPRSVRAGTDEQTQRSYPDLVFSWLRPEREQNSSTLAFQVCESSA